MTKILIQPIGERNYHGGERIVLTWEEYQVFCRQVPGEGETWRAIWL